MDDAYMPEPLQEPQQEYTPEPLQEPPSQEMSGDVFQQALELGLGSLGYLAGVVPTGSDTSSGLDFSRFLSEVKPDTWAKLAGGLIGGIGQSFVAGRKLDIEQQNANTNQQAVDLRRVQDERSATSASGLNWNGIINKNQTKPIKPGQPLLPAQPRTTA